jgi:alpha-tubulin suppressor-like RCC1 family protein
MVYLDVLAGSSFIAHKEIRMTSDVRRGAGFAGLCFLFGLTACVSPESSEFLGQDEAAITINDQRRSMIKLMNDMSRMAYTSDSALKADRARTIPGIVYNPAMSTTVMDVYTNIVDGAPLIPGQVDMLVLAFRGTVPNDVGDVCRDLESMAWSHHLNAIGGFPDSGLFLRGFQNRWTKQANRANLVAGVQKPSVKQLLENYRTQAETFNTNGHQQQLNVYVTGHSLGGAVAEIAGLDIGQYLYAQTGTLFRSAVSVYSFNAPQIGVSRGTTVPGKSSALPYYAGRLQQWAHEPTRLTMHKFARVGDPVSTYPSWGKSSVWQTQPTSTSSGNEAGDLNLGYNPMYYSLRTTGLKGMLPSHDADWTPDIAASSLSDAQLDAMFALDPDVPVVPAASVAPSPVTSSFSRELRSLTDGFAPPLIAAGSNFTCAYTKSSGITCWGSNDSGQLGNGTAGATFSAPVKVSVIDTAISLSAGLAHACAIDDGGVLYCWGQNGVGQLGTGNTSSSHVPLMVKGLPAGDPAVVVSAMPYSTCTLLASGKVYCWGANAKGQLGVGSTTDHIYTPQQVAGVWDRLAAGGQGRQMCAVSTSGASYCWGQNGNGQLGNDSTVQSNVPVAGALGTYSILATGNGETCGADLPSYAGGTGAVACWGGYQGASSTDSVGHPVAVSSVPTGNIVGLSSGSGSSCLLTDAGAVSCWGQNNEGVLGNNSTVGSAVPVPVALPGTVFALGISQGLSHACAVTSDETVYCWGSNSNGQLGVPASTISSPVPVMTSGSIVYASCNEVLAVAGGNAGSGTYFIDPDGPGPVSPMSVHCDMTFDAGDGVGPGGWTLVESLTGKAGPQSAVLGAVQPGTTSALPLNVLQALAAESLQVHIRTPAQAATQSITSRPGTSPILNLQAGRILNDLSDPQQTTSWIGPFADTSHLDFSCPTTGQSYGMWPNVYWACNNQSGLHIVGPHARWQWSGGNTASNTAFEVYVR